MINNLHSVLSRKRAIIFAPARGSLLWLRSRQFNLLKDLAIFFVPGSLEWRQRLLIFVFFARASDRSFLLTLLMAAPVKVNEVSEIFFPMNFAIHVPHSLYQSLHAQSPAYHNSCMQRESYPRQYFRLQKYNVTN